MAGPPIVLHLIDSFGVGGAQQRYFNDLEHLGPPFEHWPCAVFAQDGAAAQGARLTMPMRSLGLRRLRGLPLAFASLMKLLRENPAISVIHTQLFAADTIGRIAGRLNGIPVVSTIQSSMYEPDSGLYSGWRHRIDRWTARWTTQVVAVSDFVRRSTNVRLAVPLDKIVLIPNAVDTRVVHPDAARRAKARAELGLTPGTPGVSPGVNDVFVWLNVGRLHPAKGLAYLIDALARIVPAHPKTLLLVAGPGPQLGELERQALARGVADHIRFLGERGDVLALFDAADAFVFPSLSEGLPVSVIEVMAMKKPCVVSRIGPHEELVADRESGLLALPRDDRSLAAAMTAIQDDPMLARRLGEAARLRVEQAFDARTGADRLMDLYASLYRGAIPAASARC